LVGIDRVIALSEILITRLTHNTSKKDPYAYHSFDFYLAIDFLEKIKLIRRSKILDNELFYSVDISEE